MVTSLLFIMKWRVEDIDDDVETRKYWREK